MNYTKYLSRAVTDIKPSGIRKFFDVAATMKDCISLGVGEPDFDTSLYARQAAIESLIQGKTKYTSNVGTIELRTRVSEYLSIRFGLNYDPSEEIMITVGVSEGIDIAVRALVNPQEEVLIPEPCYVSYAPSVILAGGKPVGVPCSADNGFILTPELLQQYITDRTKLILLAFPNNPTGGIMTKEQLEAIAPIIIKNDLLVLSDEVYGELSYHGIAHVSIASIKGMMERTIVLNGLSKAFAMTGFRVGYIAAPKELCQQMLKIHQYTIMCAPTVGQMAAEAAIREEIANDFANMTRMREIYNTKRKFLYKGLIELGLECYEPQGAFYLFPDVSSSGLNGDQFANELLKSQKLALVPGDAFGDIGKNHIRISYAYSMENIEKALERLQKFMSRG